MVIRSYVRSTDDHRKPCGEDIFSSIDVAVNAPSLTTRTVPTTNTQWQLIHHKPAFVTSFTTREKAVNLDQLTTVPFALVLKLSKQFAPSGIGDRPSQFAVTNHVSDREVFNSQNAIFSDQPSCQLVQEIGTEVFNFGVYTSYLKSRFISVARAADLAGTEFRLASGSAFRTFGFPAQFLLRYLEFFVQPIEVFRVSYLFAIAGTEQASYASINPNLFLGRWQWLNSLIINQQRDKPPTRWLKFHRNGRWLTAFWKRSRPDYIQWFRAFCQPKSVISVLESRLGKLSRTTIALGFKPWVLSFFAPEISEGFLQMPQTLLQRYTTNLIEKVQLRSLFPTGQQARGADPAGIDSGWNVALARKAYRNEFRYFLLFAFREFVCSQSSLAVHTIPQSWSPKRDYRPSVHTPKSVARDFLARQLGKNGTCKL